MLRLTTKLACSNLIKNRKLYYPFAIAVILAVTIAYLFDSLTFNPHIKELGSIQEWAGVFPLFHWSFIPWAFYLVLALSLIHI